MGAGGTTFKPSLERSAAYCQHDYLPPGQLTPERLICSALPAIVLTSTIADPALGRIITVDGARNTSVCADVAYVYGRIVAPGRNIKIVARARPR